MRCIARIGYSDQGSARGRTDDAPSAACRGGGAQRRVTGGGVWRNRTTEPPATLKCAGRWRARRHVHPSVYLLLLPVRGEHHVGDVTSCAFYPLGLRLFVPVPESSDARARSDTRLTPPGDADAGQRGPVSAFNFRAGQIRPTLDHIAVPYWPNLSELTGVLLEKYPSIWCIILLASAWDEEKKIEEKRRRFWGS